MPENIVQITSQLTAWPWQQATAHAAETPFLFPSVASQGSLAEDSGLSSTNLTFDEYMFEMNGKVYKP